MMGRGAIIACIFALAACAAPETAKVEPAPERTPSEEPAVESAKPAAATAPVVQTVPAVSEVEILLGEFQRLRRLPPAELAREQETARIAFNQSRSDVARVRLAMAIGVPGGPMSEEQRALELLDPLVKTPGAQLHSLAFMMTSYLQEQRRLALQLHGAQQNLQGMQQNLQALQQKLDALKTLERSLSERGEPGAPRRR